MQKDALPEEILGVCARLEAELPRLHLERIDGEERTIIAAVGDAQAVAEMGIESLSGVERLVPIDQSYKLAARMTRAGQSSSFSLAGREWGGGSFSLILGPCTIEGRESALETATLCARAGAGAIRAGVFKPRTSPFSFQGPGRAGLEILSEIKAETRLPVVSELTDSADGEALAEVADIIQIGARNMQNYSLLQTVGKLGRPVLLKRGFSATLDELLQAADYILREGEERIILCERGIRTFDQSARFTLDLGAVPLLQEKTHLPVFVDPSHAAGRRDLVLPFARGAAAIGADGLIVETITNPEHARCDANQQLDARVIGSFAREMNAIAAGVGKRVDYS